MTETEEVTIDPKDITYDILIDDMERPDRDGPEAAGGPAGPKGDHPLITVLGMAVKHSEDYLKKQGLPPANTEVYEDFSKPFLNEAFWYYLPDGGSLDDPKVALVVGVAGLGLAFAPTLIALYERKEEEKRREEEEKKRKRNRREENGEGEEEEKREREEPPATPPPDWMTRLESGGRFGGM